MKVCILHKIPGNAQELIKNAGHEVVVNEEERSLGSEEVRKFVEGTDAILSLLTDKIDSAVMDAAGPQLKIIANYAVGFDNIDLAAAKQRNIFVTNTPEVLTEAVAEHTFALILAVARRIVEADKYVRAGKYHSWKPDLFLGAQLAGKTLGIVGLGRIGSQVAKIGHHGFGMEIAYFSRQEDPALEVDLGAKYYSNLEDLLPIADVVSIHLPLAPETTHLFSQKQISLMKKTAILINTARGPIVDEAALITALKENWLAGAGLDVFEEETGSSTGSTMNHELITMNNVILTPHIASATLEARSEMSRLAAENIIQALSGESPKNLVQVGP